jgi:hypothetical protein
MVPVFVLFAAAGIAAAQQVSRSISISTSLTSAAEVPGPGDEDGKGRAELTLDPAQGRLCFSLTVSGISPATAAQIHRAVAGQAGPVVVKLTAPATGSAKDCVSVDRELIKSILRNPTHYYLNVINAEFPAGAVRGQLSR